MKNTPRLLTKAFLPAFAIIIAGMPAFAANGTWNGEGDGTNWFDSENWVGETMPGANSGTSNTDVATFNQALTPTAINMGSYLNLRRIDINQAGDYTFNGTVLHLNGGAIGSVIGRVLKFSGTGTTTVNSDIVLNPGETGGLFGFDNRASGASDFMTITGNVSGGVSTSSIQLNLDGSRGGTVSGNISDGGSTSGVKVRKQGGGVWALSGNNTYTGGTEIVTNRLDINSSTAIGSGALIMSGSGRLGNSSGAAVTLTTNNTQQWSGGLGFAVAHDLNLGTGAVTLLGDTTFRSQSTVGNLIVGGNIGDGGAGYGVSKVTDAEGALILTGNLSYGGATSVSNGGLVLSGNNTYGGGTNVSGGHLHINSAGAVATGTLTISGGSIDNSSGSAVTMANTVSQVWNANLSFAGSNDLNMGTGAVSLGSVATATRTVTVSASVLTVDGVITDGTNVTTPTKNIIKSGAGVLRLGGDNEYTGTTTVSAGTLLVNGTHSGGGNYSISNGGILGGTGTIETGGSSVSLASGAKLAPGDLASIGTLTFDLGATNLNISTMVNGSNSLTLLFTLGASGSNDRIVLANPLAALIIGNGILAFDDFVFSTNGSFTGGEYVLFETGQLIDGTLGANLEGQINGLDAVLGLSGDGQNIILSVAVIPEPGVSMLALLGVGLLAVTLRRRNRPRLV